MYFVHSYYACPTNASDALARSDYGGVEFTSAIRRSNVVAFQFHPERSGPDGLRIYANIRDMAAARAAIR
jgi:glutamine amidotransferase